jgi:hypothetical protein
MHYVMCLWLVELVKKVSYVPRGVKKSSVPDLESNYVLQIFNIHKNMYYQVPTYLNLKC